MKKAVIVGINKYTPELNADLLGCVNDAEMVAGTLKDVYSFKPDNIDILTNEDATRDNILRKLRQLITAATPDDYLVFHFSGHGSQIPDTDGDEPDHMDELICPHDMNWRDKYISDDHLNALFNKLPNGALLEVVLDCCHSGTGLRALKPPPAVSGQKDSSGYRKNRYLPPPARVMASEHPVKRSLKPASLKIGERKAGQQNCILWAGCKDNQTSADAYIDSDYYGAFTYYLHTGIRRTPDISRSLLIQNVTRTLKDAGFEQDPQLEIDAISLESTIFVIDSR